MHTSGPGGFTLVFYLISMGSLDPSSCYPAPQPFSTFLASALGTSPGAASWAPSSPEAPQQLRGGCRLRLLP